MQSKSARYKRALFKFGIAFVSLSSVCNSELMRSILLMIDWYAQSM